MTVSVIEIYCERIRDLLDPGNDNLQVQQERLRGITVAHTTEVPVSSEAELVMVMQKGLANRAVASTAMNAGSFLTRHNTTIANQTVSATCHDCKLCPAMYQKHAQHGSMCLPVFVSV